MSHIETAAVERYQLGDNGKCSSCLLMPTEAMVRHADYLTLQAQLTALQDAVKEMLEQRDQLRNMDQCYRDNNISEDDWPGQTAYEVLRDFEEREQTAAKALRALVDPSPQEKT